MHKKIGNYYRFICINVLKWFQNAKNQNIQKENRCHTNCLAERQEQSAEKLTLHFEDAIIFLNSKKDACGNEEKRAE